MAPRVSRGAAWLAGLAVLLLAGCAGKPERPGEVSDGPGSRDLRPEDVADAVPRAEPRSRYGNPATYEVFGKTYRVATSADGYVERGLASWYGSKFHGRRTSSGEPFDMYLATAAHKSLPLPTYARVTNLDNGRSVVVKINDRGPFKDDRIIDLSYGAAVKIGMIATGTAPVEVRALPMEGGAPQPAPAAIKEAAGSFLQVGAFRRRESAENLAGRMMAQHIQPVSIQRGGGLHKVWVGPFDNPGELEATASRIIDLGYDRPHKVTP